MLIAGFALLCVFWGTSWVAIKFSLLGIPPFLGAALRFLVALFCLAIYARWKRLPLIPQGKERKLALATGLLVYFCNYGLIYWAELHLSAGLTALFFSTFPLFTGLFSNFLFRLDRYHSWLYPGLAMALSGMAIVFYDETSRAQATPQTLLAMGAVLVSAASGATSSLLVKKHLTRVPPVTLTFSQMIAGSAGLLGIGLLSGEAGRMHYSLPSLLAVLYLGLAASAVAFVLYYWLLQRMSAVTLSMFVYITPLVAIFTDWLLLDQRLSTLSWMGVGVVLSGVLLSQWGRRGELRRPRVPV